MKNMFLILNMMVFIGCNTIVASVPLPRQSGTTVVLDDVPVAVAVVTPAAEDTTSGCCSCLGVVCCPVTVTLATIASVVLYPCVACKVYVLNDQTVPVTPSCCVCNIDRFTEAALQCGCYLGMGVVCCPCTCCDNKAQDYMVNLRRSMGAAGKTNEHRLKMQRQLAEEEAAREQAEHQAPAQEAVMQ